MRFCFAWWVGGALLWSLAGPAQAETGVIAKNIPAPRTSSTRAAKSGKKTAYPGTLRNPWGLDEDWSTPSLATSHLVADKPFVAMKAEPATTFTREMVRLQWRPADPINLYILRPKNAVKPPVVVYLYGYPRGSQFFLNDQFGELVTASGCAAVGFDTALTNERYGRLRPIKEWFVAQLPESLATSAHDVQLVLDYLATRGDLDTRHVGIYGQGSGGAIATLAAGVDPRIKVVDLFVPWGDWPDWVKDTLVITQDERPQYLKPEFLANVAPLDPVRWLPRLKDRKVRVTIVKDEGGMPYPALSKVAAAAPTGAEVRRFERDGSYIAAMKHGTVEWAGTQLAALSAPAGTAPARNIGTVPASNKNETTASERTAVAAPQR